MAEIETVKITELDPTSSANAVDQLLIRQGVTDKRISVDALKNSIISGATSSAAGIVQLNNTTSSTSTTQAATANAVRLAYNRGSSALTYAQGVNSALSGKANTTHTHNASQITSGIMSQSRLPLGTFNQQGIVRIDQTNGGQSSSAGYVPSVERVNSLQQQINTLSQTVSNVLGGVAFMPLPVDNAGDPYARNFPVGSYLLACGTEGVGVRNQVAYVTPVAAASTGFTSASLGQYALGGSPQSGNLPGKWLHRGAVGVFLNPVGKGVKGYLRTGGMDDSGVGADYNQPGNIAFLVQRVA